MSTKTSKPKTISTNRTASKNGISTNGVPAKSKTAKKSINELWIEKYGVDDSATARKFRKAWKMAYDSHNQPKP